MKIHNNYNNNQNFVKNKNNKKLKNNNFINKKINKKKKFNHNYKIKNDLICY